MSLIEINRRNYFPIYSKYCPRKEGRYLRLMFILFKAAFHYIFMLLHITFWLDKYMYQMNIVNNDNVDLVDYQKLYKHITYLCFFFIMFNTADLSMVKFISRVHINVYDKSQPYIIRHQKKRLFIIIWKNVYTCIYIRTGSLHSVCFQSRYVKHHILRLISRKTFSFMNINK